jgi:NAD(P)-dependent dehydrogenase (short-subunit alcohol dehydrogenase family)
MEVNPEGRLLPDPGGRARDDRQGPGQDRQHRLAAVVPGRHSGGRPTRPASSGLAGLTKLLANEWAAKGVNVNAIAPGYFVTNNTEALRKDADRSRQILERIPAGRWGQPGDLGGAAVFLASQAADYVQGITLPVDGGWLAR